MICKNPRHAIILAIIVFIFFLVQLVACQYTHSLTVLMNTYQTLFNLMSLALIVISQRIASTEGSLRNTFGWARMEVVGTLVAVLFLFALCFAVTTTSLQTLLHSGHEETAPQYPLIIMVFGVMSLSLNIFCHLITGDPVNTRNPGSYISVRGNRVQVNFVESGSTHGINKPCERSTREATRYLSEGEEGPLRTQDQKQPSFLMESLRAAGSSIMVIVCASVLHFAEGHGIVQYIDAVLALNTVAIIIFTFYPDVRNSGLILLQTVPEDVDVDKLQQSILRKFPELINLHDLHIWALNDDHCIATIHITLTFCSQNEYEKLSTKIEEFFVNNGIDSVTIQPEFSEFEEAGPVKCALKCPACTQHTCCIGESLDQKAEVFAMRKRRGSKESFLMSSSHNNLDDEVELKVL